jgi:hypothetical protein
MKRPSEASADMTKRGSWNLYKNQILTFLFKIFTLSRKKKQKPPQLGHFTDVGSQKRLGGRFIGLAGDLGVGGRSGPLAGGGNADASSQEAA